MTGGAAEVELEMVHVRDRSHLIRQLRRRLYTTMPLNWGPGPRVPGRFRTVQGPRLQQLVGEAVRQLVTM